ncbi:MAG: hypothetical protein HOV80_06605 [Polyangiaceae bacterium]|nr:hypothetical protein [Polyangiaceae bacterium]
MKLRSGALACVLLTPFACTFPDVEVVYTGGGGSGGAATTTTTAATTAATTASTSVTTTASTGMGGEGGSDPCDLDDDGSQAVSCGGPDCDDDGDDHDSNDPMCGGDDCDDANGEAHPMQREPQAQPRANGSWDYDCDEIEEPEHKTTCLCPGQILAGVEAGPAGCGQMGNTTTCVVDTLLVCEAGMTIQSGVIQRCL